MEIKLANPQGKGLERISDALQILQEVRVEHKKPIQILRDYCCSLLVLASEFSFLPIPNRYYFLFLSGDKFKLSPISPKEWGHSRFGDYIAKCRLETDMTWSGIWRQDLEDFPALNEKIRGHMRNSLELIFESDKITDNLPFFDRDLSYYRRVLALGLSSSIELSLKKVDLHCLSGRDLLQSFGVELGSLYKYLLFRDEDHADLT